MESRIRLWKEDLSNAVLVTVDLLSGVSGVTCLVGVARGGNSGKKVVMIVTKLRRFPGGCLCPIPGVTIEKYKDNANCETIHYM